MIVRYRIWHCLLCDSTEKVGYRLFHILYENKLCLMGDTVMISANVISTLSRVLKSLFAERGDSALRRIYNEPIGQRSLNIDSLMVQYIMSVFVIDWTSRIRSVLTVHKMHK